MVKYLQKAWSDSVDDINMQDIVTAIAETKDIDEEHGAFWVGTEEEEYVMETDRSLNMILVKEGKEQLRYSANGWEEVEKLYELFLAERFQELINIMG